MIDVIPLPGSCRFREPAVDAVNHGYGQLFGVAQPGRAEYASLAGSERLYDFTGTGRWTGRVALLWSNGAPNEMVLRGWPGD